MAQAATPLLGSRSKSSEFHMCYGQYQTISIMASVLGIVVAGLQAQRPYLLWILGPNPFLRGVFWTVWAPGSQRALGNSHELQPILLVSPNDMDPVERAILESRHRTQCPSLTWPYYPYINSYIQLWFLKQKPYKHHLSMGLIISTTKQANSQNTHQARVLGWTLEEPPLITPR